MTHVIVAWTVWTLFRHAGAAASDLISRQRITSALHGLAVAGTGETTVPNLIRWANITHEALTGRWPDTALEASTYPAFGGAPFDHAN